MFHLADSVEHIATHYENQLHKHILHSKGYEGVILCFDNLFIILTFVPFMFMVL